MADPTYNKLIDLAHLSRFKTKQDAYNVATYLGIHATADAAAKLDLSDAAGAANQPVYFSAAGVPVACTYELNKTVPADAVFTDTTYSPVVADSTGAADPGLMTSADKSKLDGIAAGAEVNQNAFSSIVVGSDSITADAKTDSFSVAAGANVQVSVSGDALSISATDTTYEEATTSTAGLMSAADKTKLDGIEASADVNVLEGVQVNGTDLTIDANKKVNITFADGDSTGGLGSIKLNGTAYTVYGLGDAAAAGLATAIADGETGLASGDQVYDAIQSALTSALVYKGVKATVAELPSSGQKVGDLWHVTADGGEYAWDGSAWQEMGSILDLSDYVQFSDISLADNTDIDGLFA